MFFIKPRKLIIDFFTTEPIVESVNAPRRASKKLPQWWKDTPASFQDAETPYPRTTIKNCVGLIDYFYKSICMPMWCDFVIEVGQKNTNIYRYQYANHTSVAENHSGPQLGGFLPDEEYQHIKLVNVWRAKTKQDVDWLITQPSWSYKNSNPIIMPPGMLNFSWQTDLQANIFIPRLDSEIRKLTINAGEPLFFMTPLFDGCFDLRLHRVTSSEFNSLMRPRLFFTGDGLKIRKCMRENVNKL